MHRCLHILEILEGIFDNVGNTATRSTLFNIALTCRVFYEPAIDVLWRSLPDLMPLANLLSMYHPNDDVDHPSVSPHHLCNISYAYIPREYQSGRKPSVKRMAANPSLHTSGARTGSRPRGYYAQVA